ncbi:hypothetical protein GGI20_003104 [Coemansia sp. BCRC 34301]|nr:hypothetical protein GGI20_003104 [Coemansia sp. BCRC 34301]
MHGRVPERSVSVCGKESEFGSDAGVLRFVLRPHAVFSGILEMVDYENNGVVYRKISRNGRSWSETFHKVSDHAYVRACQAVGPASFSSVSSKWTTAARPALPQAASSTLTSASAPLSHRYPPAFELNQLWEMSSPCPMSFPLHCRDTRGVIDPIPMTALVADRLQFCYRFHLAGNKMKWMAKPASTRTMDLQCFVRTTPIALLQFGNSLVPNRRGRLQRLPPAKAVDAGARVEERLPVVTIFPLAFAKLAPIEADVVESFILFTGVEVLECLLLQNAVKCER